jgi:hypothetical protein
VRKIAVTVCALTGVLITTSCSSPAGYNNPATLEQTLAHAGELGPESSYRPFKATCDAGASTNTYVCAVISIRAPEISNEIDVRTYDNGSAYTARDMNGDIIDDG